MKPPIVELVAHYLNRTPRIWGWGRRTPMKKIVISTHHSSMIVHFVGAGSLWLSSFIQKIYAQIPTPIPSSQ
jgi:hypothetical protein